MVRSMVSSRCLVVSSSIVSSISSSMVRSMCYMH
jgi:hypothetical protein